MGALMACARRAATAYLGVTMNRALSIVALIACIAIPLLVGCSYERAESPPDRNRDSVYTTAPTTERRKVREERIRDAREDSADSSRVALAYPTGNRSTSAVLVERMSPPEVRL